VSRRSGPPSRDLRAAPSGRTVLSRRRSGLPGLGAPRIQLLRHAGAGHQPTWCHGTRWGGTSKWVLGVRSPGGCGHEGKNGELGEPRWATVGVSLTTALEHLVPGSGARPRHLQDLRGAAAQGRLTTTPEPAPNLHRSGPSIEHADPATCDQLAGSSWPWPSGAIPTPHRSRHPRSDGAAGGAVPVAATERVLLLRNPGRAPRGRLRRTRVIPDLLETSETRTCDRIANLRLPDLRLLASCPRRWVPTHPSVLHQEGRWSFATTLHTGLSTCVGRARAGARPGGTPLRSAVALSNWLSAGHRI
jgi:hypothetical protein